MPAYGFDLLVSRLDYVRMYGDARCRAQCPSCKGNSRNALSVRDGGESILLHCFKGCTYREVLDAIGLKPSDLFRENSDFDREEWKRRKYYEAAGFEKLIIDCYHGAKVKGWPVSREDHKRMELAQQRLRKIERALND